MTAGGADIQQLCTNLARCCPKVSRIVFGSNDIYQGQVLGIVDPIDKDDFSKARARTSAPRGQRAWLGAPAHRGGDWQPLVDTVTESNKPAVRGAGTR